MQIVSEMPREAAVLGWAGVLPFAGFALQAITGGVLAPESAAKGIVIYGAVILSFMGGVQWGLAMMDAEGRSNGLGRGLAISVWPALAAFCLPFLPTLYALVGLVAAFLALLIYDLSIVRSGRGPAWYAPLRIQLTSAVVLCLLATAVFGRS